MIAEITCTFPSGKTDVIPSKSVAHRLLICAALSDNPTEIICPAESLDIAATARCLASLGAELTLHDGVYSVFPIKETKEAVLSCGESGSTLRFLIPVAAALGRDVTFTGEGRLPERPVSPLADCLASRGAAVDYDGTLPLTTHGGLCGGRFTLPGNVSSQFISGLIFALPLLAEDSEIDITGKIESLPYIKMTLDAVSSFGIKAKMQGNKIIIPGKQTYRSPGKLTVEGDWSNAAFWLCLGALSENGITVHGLKSDSIQGDRAVLDILSRFGAEITRGDTGITVRKKTLSAVRIDASGIPDLVPVLSVVAAVANGETRITGAGRLRIKESDRIESTVNMLRSLGADAEPLSDGIRIFGKKRLSGGRVDSANDHRIAMSAAIAAAVSDGAVSIYGAEAVRKSYGDFYEKYAALGAVVNKKEA